MLSTSATFEPCIRRLDDSSLDLIATASLELIATASALDVAQLPIVKALSTEATGASGRSGRTALGVLLSGALARVPDAETIQVHRLGSAAVLSHVPHCEDFVAARVLLAASRVADALGDVEDIATHEQKRRIANFGHARALSGCGARTGDRPSVGTGLAVPAPQSIGSVRPCSWSGWGCSVRSTTSERRRGTPS